MKKAVVFLIFVLTGFLLAVSLGRETAVAETAVPVGNTWSTPKVISTGITNAKRPVIQADPNQPGKIMVLFISQAANNTPIDPFYTVSQNYGTTWTTPAAIHESVGVESKQIHFDFDDQGTAHAAWREGRALAYANSANWSTSFQTLSNPNGDPGVTTPAVATFGSNIHIVWSEGNTNDPNPLKTVPNILYTRSKDRGATWLTEPLVLTNTGFDSVSPAITVDPAGNVHVVWQELQFDTGIGNYVVNYVKGTVSTNSVTWSTPINISNAIDTSSSFSSQEPRITYTNTGLKVTLTTIFQQPAEQYVYLLSCRSSCENLNRWTNEGGVSGTALYVNIEPVDLASSPSDRLGCTYVFFDGATTDNLSGKEQVWMANSCNGWTNAREEITDTTIRALRPSSASQANWLYLTYEESLTNDSGNANQIYFQSNESDYGAYLPMLRK
ncbi:MAG: hypothetical protein KBE23_10870 [Chloroflexi bacterium]|nr:hypothetical protein [Chloroflexota bacterium]MBP7043234.1 hypothetical protein [Chloroflexota bacterium]